MAKRHRIRAKRGQNQIFICLFLSHLGKIGDSKRQNTNIFLKARKENRCGCGRLACLLACPLVQVARLFVASGPARGCSGPLVVCSLLLPALSLCLWCVAHKYAFVSHFKGVFSGFPLLDVGLYWSRALRGLWGFCVREWLGGLEA